MESKDITSSKNNLCLAAHILVGMYHSTSSSSYILVVSVDGTIYGVDRNDGTILWTQRYSDSVPLDKSNLNPIDNSIFIPDPVSGGVYHYDTRKKLLQKLDVSLKEMANQPAFIAFDGKRQTSSMSSEILTLDPFSGKLNSDHEFALHQSIFITKYFH